MRGFTVPVRVESNHTPAGFEPTFTSRTTVALFKIIINSRFIAQFKLLPTQLVKSLGKTYKIDLALIFALSTHRLTPACHPSIKVISFHYDYVIAAAA